MTARLKPLRAGWLLPLVLAALAAPLGELTSDSQSTQRDTRS